MGGVEGVGSVMGGVEGIGSVSSFVHFPSLQMPNGTELHGVPSSIGFGEEHCPSLHSPGISQSLALHVQREGPESLVLYAQNPGGKSELSRA